MKILKHIDDVKKDVNKINNLGLVPTMGGLHKGHLSLIKESKKKCKKTLVTIFINPRQFNKINDFKKYPRQLDKDILLLKKLKVNFLFLPNKNEIYKNKNFKKIALKKNEKILCAKFRNGHFEGVLDIMKRFINLICPEYVFMGEKDFQQYYLVKKYLQKNNKTKILKCKTIRDKNFVPLSTRNFLLSKKDINIASKISICLKQLRSQIINNHEINYLIKKIKLRLQKKYKIKIEYLEARSEKDLQLNIKNKKFKLFIAYYLKKIRLIDNL